MISSLFVELEFPFQQKYSMSDSGRGRGGLWCSWRFARTVARGSGETLLRYITCSVGQKIVQERLGIIQDE